MGVMASMMVAKKTGQRLEELAHPSADEVANRGDAHADDEHVKTGPKDSAAREDGPGGADKKVRQHREREGNDDRRRALPDQKRKNRNHSTEGSRQPGDPSFSQRRHVELADFQLFLHL